MKILMRDAVKMFWDLLWKSINCLLWRKKKKKYSSGVCSDELHEFGRRPGRWVFTEKGEGEDLLGKLLTKVRQIIIEK